MCGVTAVTAIAGHFLAAQRNPHHKFYSHSSPCPIHNFQKNQSSYTSCSETTTWLLQLLSTPTEPCETDCPLRMPLYIHCPHSTAQHSAAGRNCTSTTSTSKIRWVPSSRPTEARPTRHPGRRTITSCSEWTTTPGMTSKSGIYVRAPAFQGQPA